MSRQTLTLAAIRNAAVRIAPYVHRTPVMTSQTLNALAGATLYFKCENLQRIGAFKARGAHNAVFSLDDATAGRGVVTHSSGNHAAALSLAARNRGIRAHIVMPSNAPAAKVESVKRLGGLVTSCEPTLQAREATARRVLDETGGTLVHPYDNHHVMAGQGTAALELLDEVPDLDAVVCPVGGGGLLSGTGCAAKNRAPAVRVFAVEPAGADDAQRSFRSGELVPSVKPTTIADGLLTSLSERTFLEIKRYVDDIVTVADDEIVVAMKLVWSVMKIVIEPSAAVPVAAVVGRKIPGLSGKRVGVILTGGNLDLDQLPWVKTA